MNKKMIIALFLFALTVVVLLFNMKGMPQINVDLYIASFKVYQSMAFLGFTLMGIVIGLLFNK